uniref:Potassium channel subfamily K member 4 n=1 Tax=Mola mola TaxID=94237 RepID=A0A3Q4AV43_MOLML
MRCSTLLGILTGVLLYLVLGSVVFRALETPQEENKHMQLQDTRRDFLMNFTCVGPDNLQDLIKEVVEAVSAGVDPSSNITFVSQWDLASAFFFSGTIITTIGFGNTSPKTEGGQLFCIFYALVGIPMFGILLAGVGDHLGTGLRKLVAKIENLFLKWRVSPTIVRVISAVLSILLGCLLFVAVPILVFQEVERWTLLESAYFVVITLTTVGFGDYVAGSGNDGNDHWYKPLVWFWILLGLAYFASILTMIGNWLRVLSKKTRAEVLLFYRLTAPAKASPWTSQPWSPYINSQATQTDRVPEEKSVENPPDPHLTQPLDYFGENLAFIDESSDAQSGKLHLDPLIHTAQPNSARYPKRRRQRRPVPQRPHRVSRSNPDKREHNGNPKPAPGLPQP